MSQRRTLQGLELDMRLLAGLVMAAAFATAPAFADPTVSASMPVIKASVSGADLVVRMEKNLKGSARNLEPRTLVVTARDASGKVVAETTRPVSIRMTYARMPMTAAMQSASALTVSLR